MSTAEETREGFYLDENGEWVPNGWSMDRISSVFPYVVDNRGKTPPVDPDGRFELIEVNAISKHSRKPVYSAVIKFLSEETFRNWFRKGTLQAGDILIPTVGTIGEASICLDNRGAIAQNLVGLRCCESNIPLYWYYWFCSPHSKKLILNLDIGGVQPSVKVPHLLEQKVKFPAKSEQKAIAAVLGSLDDKIELLREQNETLEALAQTLFKRWFIDFNFPDKNGNPFKDSGGKMIASELGEIPDGWQVAELKDIVTQEKQAVRTESITDNTKYVGLEHILRKHLQLADHGWGKDVSSNKSGFSRGDILFGKLRPYFHKVCVAPFDGICSTDILVLNVHKKHWYSFALMHVYSERLIEFVTLASTGTKMPRTNFSEIGRFRIPLPSEPMAESFNEACSKLLAKGSCNTEQIEILTQLRDTLLPKLMKGEIRVPFES